MYVFFLITTIVFALLFSASCYFLWKFAKIIMIFEDDLSETINSLNDVEDSINNVLNMQMFFDSPEVQKSVQNVLEQVKLCRMSIQSVVKRFTARSKRQYVTVWEERIGAEPEADMEMPRMPGQPPNTPNPLKTIYKQYGE